jgi:hypothetical protein
MFRQRPTSAPLTETSLFIYMTRYHRISCTYRTGLQRAKGAPIGEESAIVNTSTMENDDNNDDDKSMPPIQFKPRCLLGWPQIVLLYREGELLFPK